MGKKKRIKHHIERYPKKKKIVLINKKNQHSKRKNITKRLLQKKKIRIPIIKFPEKEINFNKPLEEKKGSTTNLTGSIEILKIKEQKNKNILTKKEKIPKENKIKEPKEKSALGRKIFLLTIFIIIGGFISYLFNNTYGYVLLGFLIFFQLVSILKTPKKKKEEIKKPSSPEQPKKIYLTEFDKFYNYINEKKKVSTTNIASHFKMTKKQVEDWAKILESRGLIIVHYPLIGEPELRSIE